MSHGTSNGRAGTIGPLCLEALRRHAEAGDANARFLYRRYVTTTPEQRRQERKAAISRWRERVTQ